MRIVSIGGGPAGLYLGILVKLTAPKHQVVIYERNKPDDTFGFGVVFSDATLGHLAAADPETHAAITRGFARWDDIEIHFRGEVMRSTGHGFCGIERHALLAILQRRAVELGVEIRYEHEIRELADVGPADLIVAADGVASWVRDRLAPHLKPTVDVRPNKFVWLGTTVPYRAFTFLFKETPYGLFRVHAYRYLDRGDSTGSTFIVECRPDTWARAGFEGASEDETVAKLEAIFAEELGPHRLIKNRSIWRNFPTVRCKTWHHDNVVLLGDAAHTAHFSIGSGTKLAMEDAIALRDALIEEPDVESALATYEVRRRPDVESIQAAAQASLEWFEGTERYLGLPASQFAYSLATRSLRVSHASVARRDPPLARAVEQLLAQGAGRAEPTPPMFVPVTLGGMALANRLALAPWTLGGTDGGIIGDGHLVFLGGRATGGVGLVMTETVAAELEGAPAGMPGLASDDQVVAWRRVVDFVHERSPAKIGAQLAVFAGDAPTILAAAAQRAGFAGFDLLQLQTGVGALAKASADELCAAVSAVRAAWPADRPLSVRLVATAILADAAVALARRLRDLGVALVWVAAVAEAAAADAGGRLPAAPLADRIRNEAGIPTAIEGAVASASDVDAVIAAARCDLVALDRALVYDPGFAHRAAEATGYSR
ncbi:MAG: FAD-dependent monooxygenase [Deltaproteobacteria bacterium]|nr:FAD-dependent monooxygenase [Deltaproteobacteria bacterium]